MVAQHGAFLTRLRRDKRGNTIAIMAAALVPMLGLAGSAVDVSRMYVVKVRLQQACDAGVLAGRKFMISTTATIDDPAKRQAETFFKNNFQDGWMKTSSTVFTPVKTSAAQVSGTATTIVPMTIMKFFGFGNKPLSVTCQARYDVADTDVLFVLDTTGSMACLPADSDATCSAYVSAAGNNTYTRPSSSDQNRSVAGYAGANAYSAPEKSGSRIDALRKAVLSFWDTFDSVKDPSTRVRYGFVTYSSSVNAGRAIQDVIPSALVGSNAGDTAYYQSRHVTGEYQISRTVTAANNGKAQTGCVSSAKYTRTPAAAQTFDPSTGAATVMTQEWNSSTSKCEDVTKVMGPTWTYERYSWPVSALVAGNAVTNPTKARGQTMRWLGCVETLVDSPGATSFSATSPPDDIDPDVVPSGANRWIPQMQDLEYVRNADWGNAATDTSNGDEGYYVKVNGVYKFVALTYGSDAQFGAFDGAGNRADADYLQKSGAMACGKPVKRIGVMTRSDVDNWVKAPDFTPIGGTYHDTGMIWGARLISPTGPWAGDTQPVAAGRNVNRVIIFLTDGDMAPTNSSYSLYGLEGYDKRVSGSNTTNTLTDLHNARFLAACASAKANKIDIWTIAIDSSSSPQLTSCASNTGQAQYTTSGTDLTTIFTDIAKKLAMLRLTV